MINCILAGVGGQGTILASKLIAQTAMNKGLNARTAETIGMAQRGGCVVSHVRIGENIHSPLIPLKSADLIIGFEPAEAVRSLGYLKENGTVIVSQKAIKPITASLSNSDYNGSEMISYLKNTITNLIVVDSEKICADCGSAKVLNIALLGAAVASGALEMSLEEVRATIKDRLAERFVEMNLKALHQGAEFFRGV
ncbi:indolepyruvate ferredoxin oxidoreductase beta subunit [Desulfonispora thiosulfatigenes DSM 11270]|uniref:Indolepyruvate ferredoxin oxidoreductase beta subunit n=1 Tax=Desulfonispora thiosulfatigenes DSM 11270 TaxID=656914 RepID=A0A1W1UED0_DESTI|nr:indolepyruvate ferredoxin oxidoreductase beta subunit [Desulfonispora thiosulfatigenes DSM 11270]